MSVDLVLITLGFINGSLYILTSGFIIYSFLSFLVIIILTTLVWVILRLRLVRVFILRLLGLLCGGSHHRFC